MIALLIGIYLLLRRSPLVEAATTDRSGYAWGSVMVAAVLLNAYSTFRLEQGVRQEFAFRVPLNNPFLLNGSPIAAGSTTRFIAGSANGYRLVTAATTTWVDPSPGDDLSFSGLLASQVLQVQRQ